MNRKTIEIVALSCALSALVVLFFHDLYVRNHIDSIYEKIKSKESTETIIEEEKEEYTDYEKAKKIAKSQNKNVFIFFTADWCTYCSQMKSKTLSDKEVKNIILENNIFCLINIDKNKDLQSKFKIKTIPVCIITNDDGEILKKTEGFKSKKEFIEWMAPKKVSFIEDLP